MKREKEQRREQREEQRPAPENKMAGQRKGKERDGRWARPTF